MNNYCKILIIDDEFIMRQGMKYMLDWEKEGFQIVGDAPNGHEGLKLIEELQPHIVLADIVMPIIDGIEFSEIVGKRYPDVKLIILSSYDKFEYVKTTLLNGAVDYILKPTLNPEILLKTLKKIASQIHGLKLNERIEMPVESQMEKFLLGFQDKLDEITFANFFSNTLFRLLSIDLRNICNNQKEECVAAKNIIDGFYEDTKDYITLRIFFNKGILCIIINYKVKDESTILKDAQLISTKLSRLYKKTFFVMSRSFSNMQEIKKYYQQDIMEELNYAFYYPEKYLFIRNQYQKKESIIRFEFEKYTRYLTQSRYYEALEMFEEYMIYLVQEQVREDKLKNLSKNLLYNYLMEMEKLSVACEELKENFFEIIDNTSFIHEFQTIMGEIIAKVNHILEKNFGIVDIRIIKIRKYVEEHYFEPLELSDIAVKFGFSYHYLSTYFSHSAKEGFNEFLNKIRIKKACELLEENNLTIANISNVVGYSDHSYFCRVFKKITGLTPSDYRRKVKHG